MSRDSLPESGETSTSDGHFARALVMVYDTLVGRNPDAEGFLERMKLLRRGEKLEKIFGAIANSAESMRYFIFNQYFDNLRLKLLNIPPQRRSDLSWKADDRPLTVDYAPTIMQIELTNNCPFRCVMCPRTHRMTREQGFMEFPVFKKVIDELSELRPDYAQTQDAIWMHHFGESLTHPQFAEFIIYARSRNIDVQMSINPLMLSDKIAERMVEAAPKHVIVCLDGKDNESFEKIRGLANAYDKSKENLLAFLKMKQESGIKTRITLSIIDFPLNGERGSQERAELEAYWRSIPGIDDFMWKEFSTWTGDIAEIDKLPDLSEAEKLVYTHYDTFKITCDFPWRRMVVAWDGRVVPCCHDFNNRYELGNVKEQTLSEIWNGGPMLALRTEFITGMVQNELCKSCKYLR